MHANYPMRSLMFVPGNREDLMRKAVSSDADILLLDIEDSVQPKYNKTKARELINKLINEKTFSQKKVFIRINDRESGELLNDLMLFIRPEIHGFVYPKSKCSEDIFFIDKLLETLEYEKNIEIGSLKLIPLIETTEAVFNALNIAKSSHRIIALAYGCEDFLADLQGTHDMSELALHVPRAMIAMAARAADITPIDTVHIKVHDLTDLESNLRIAKTLGFEGMLVLNPKEISLVHAYFSPTAKEVDWANEVVLQSENFIAEGIGVAITNGKFIGPPLLMAARKILWKNNLINTKGSP
jgi:citrate lyase subunit beta/citryl-CoA lyase